MKRLVGPLHTRPRTVVAEIFGRFPGLFDAFVDFLSAGARNETLAFNCAVPLLAFLSRLEPSPEAAFPYVDLLLLTCFYMAVH